MLANVFTTLNDSGFEHVQCCILEMEYCAGGSLSDVLNIMRQNPGCQLPLPAKLNLVRVKRSDA